MCGLAGFVAGGAAPADQLAALAGRMADALVHRGPDGRGVWVDAENGVALGFRRLAVLDLTAAGDQPMASATGRYRICFNGEVYNGAPLRAELAAAGATPSYRGHSDTEVVLAAFERWGVAAAVPRFVGMFAMAVWDSAERRLHLVRDRMGVKPLYYGMVGRSFAFASELKAFHQHPDFTAAVDDGALHHYLRLLAVPGPFSIYRGIRKVVPGTILTFDPASRRTQTATYWSVRNAAAQGAGRRFVGSEDEAADAFECLARDAVGLRMLADVPVGVFLSGGVDSSLVTALMQAQSAARVKSFCVGFAEAGYDEAGAARAVAQHLGTDHTEVVMTTDDVTDAIPRLPAMFDEPFADSSAIPTHLVSAVARRQVTVSLSGDGGDELFGGYIRYFIGEALGRRIASLPAWLPPALGRTLARVPAQVWDRVLRLSGPLVPASARPPHAGQRVHKLARVLTCGDPDRLYVELSSHWPELVDETLLPELRVDDRACPPALTDAVERMMFFDQTSYLPDDILTKVDRASMAVSLEAREPLLDHRLVEFAWTLPLAMKVRDGRGKRLLRTVLARHVPPALTERPKMGFGVPLAAWLRGPLREWAESLLATRALTNAGLVQPEPVRARWRAHLAGSDDWEHELWGILMLQAWHAEQRAPAPGGV